MNTVLSGPLQVLHKPKVSHRYVLKLKGGFPQNSFRRSVCHRRQTLKRSPVTYRIPSFLVLAIGPALLPSFAFPLLSISQMSVTVPPYQPCLIRHTTQPEWQV